MAKYQQLKDRFINLATRISRLHLGSSILFLTLSVASLPVAAQTLPYGGTVIEQVDKGSGGESAGLETGDIILGWSRSELHGNIESPFDLTEIEIEQGPCGSVLLEGLRGREKHAWRMGPNAWGVLLRPPLSPALLSAYQQGQELAKNGAFAEAAERLRTGASQVQKSDPAWVGPWLLSRAAEWRAKEKQWEEADAAYRGAIQQASSAGIKVMAELLRAWGDLFRLRSEWGKAEDCYHRSIAESNKLGIANLAAATTLTKLSNVSWARGDAAKSQEYDLDALAIRQKMAPGSLAVASSLNSLGADSWSLGDLDRAEGYFRRALAVREKLAPGSLDFASTVDNLGTVAKDRGQFFKAEEYHRQALAIREKVAPGSLAVAISFNNLALVVWRRGNLSKAEEYHREALAIRERLVPGSFDCAISLDNLGTLAFLRGDLAKADEYHLRALPILEKLAPGSRDAAFCLHNLGNVASGRGDLRKAEEYFRQALALLDAVAPGSQDVAKSLNNLGLVAFNRGYLAGAEEYYSQALAIMVHQASGGLDEAEILNNLSEVARNRGDLDKAAQYGRKAVTIIDKIASGSLDHSHILNNLGLLASQEGDLPKAEEYHRNALEIREKIVPGSTHEAETLYALASTSLRRGATDQAIVFFDRAINALESQTSRLGGTEDTRSGFRARYGNYYRDYLSTLIVKNQPERAFYVLERSRARSLLAMLAERDLIFAADLSSEIQQERKLNAADYDRTQGQIAQLSPAANRVKFEQSIARLRELAAEREQITERIKRTSPRLAALQYPQPLDLQRTQQALDPGTTMLSYSVGADQTVLFVVEPSGLSVYMIAVGEKSLRDQIEDFRRLIGTRNAASRSALDQQARVLYDLLVKPAEAQIAKSDRLLIAPDGPLHNLPYGALLRGERQYMIEWKPLHTVVSATLYAELKKPRDDRRRAPLQLAAFGDPLYPKLDKQSFEKLANADVRAAAERGVTLARLPFSREEVNSIAALDPKRTQTYLGAEATEERAKSVSPKARYVHFAAHAFLDERFPLNSGLALTIPEKPTDGQENGLLQAWEIFEQMRLDADLVVLSACQTALGKELGGEGLIGLTRAFQYAGARSIVASLWNVDDLKTARLMKAFYTQLQEGRSKDKALRAAQLELLRSRNSSHPYFWAAFSLSGDWQ